MNLYNGTHKSQNGFKRIRGRIAGISAAMYCTIICSMPALADTDAIISGLNIASQKFWNMFCKIACYVAVIIAAWNGVKIIAGDSKDAGEVKRKFVQIVVGMLIVNLAPSIILTITTWFTRAAWPTFT